MGYPKIGTLSVRITAVGHASRRWTSASNTTEANRLNQLLSEVRAQNIRKTVEDIVKRELPSLPIETPAKGVGSREPFPTASEDDAAVDRCVVVMVDLIATSEGLKPVSRPPHRIYTPSTSWAVKVVSMFGGNAMGARAVFLRVVLRNLFSGREITLSGKLVGGALTLPKASNRFKFDKIDPAQLARHQIGGQVRFTTRESMDFEEWTRSPQTVRLAHSLVKTGITKSATTFLQFLSVDTDPDSMVFDLKKLGFSLDWPDFELSTVAGDLTLEGDNPGDSMLIPTPTDNVWTPNVSHRNHGLLVSFPTGKARLQDLTQGQREQLTGFVMQQIRTVGVLAETFNVSSPVP